jgi:hypothetical protein
MNVRLNSADEASLNADLNRLAIETGKTMREVLPPQMRLLAADLAHVTRPKGRSAGDNAGAMKKIAARIAAVYPPVGVVVNRLKKKDEQVGVRFAVLISKRDYLAAKKILDTHAPELNMRVGAFDGGALHRAQRESKKVKNRLLAPGYSRVEAYIKKSVRLSGFAKGGFATAARELGGVRGIPGWATRQKSPGSGRITGDGKALTVSIQNDVRYIADILKAADSSAAVNARGAAVGKLLERVQANKIRRASRHLR